MHSRWSTSVMSVCSTASDWSTLTNIHAEKPEPKNAFTLRSEVVVVDSAREKKANKTEKFRILMDVAESDLNKKYDEYINKPGLHPDYSREWKLYWERRYKEHSYAKKTINLRDIKEEWVILWKQMLERKLKREIETKKQEISRRLWMSNYELTEIENTLAKEHEKLTASSTSSKERRNKLSSNEEKNKAYRKRLSISPRRSPSIHQRCSNFSSRRSQSPQQNRQRNPSPPRNSRSPQRRSGSPPRNSRSPQRRSRLPQRKSRSPQRRSRLPQRRSRSPQRRSRSPQRRSHSPQRRSCSPQQKSRTSQRRSCSPQRKSRSPRSSSPINSRRRVCMDFDKKRFHWIKPTITSVLSLLTALEDMLGSLGPKVIALMRKVIAMDKAKANSSHQLLDNEEHYVLFKTIKEKLQGFLSTNLVESNRENAVKKAIKDISYLVEETDNRVKPCHMETAIKSEDVLSILSVQQELSPLKSPMKQKLLSPTNSMSPSRISTAHNVPPLVNKEEREAIEALLNKAFVNAGITNVTGKQLQGLSDVYIAEMARKINKTDDKDGSSMDIINREEINDCGTNNTVDESISSSPVSDSTLNVLAVPLTTEIPLSSLSDLPSDLPVLCSSVLPSSTSTGPFQAQPDVVVNENEKVTLSDMELKILMKKFYILSSKEQKTYQAYMKNLEVKEPERFKRLTGNETS